MLSASTLILQPAWGVKSDLIYASMLVMSALAVVLLIRVVGLILIISMLTIPPYMAERMSNSLKGMMIYSTVFSLVFFSCGAFLCLICLI